MENYSSRIIAEVFVVWVEQEGTFSHRLGTISSLFILPNLWKSRCSLFLSPFLFPEDNFKNLNIFTLRYSIIHRLWTVNYSPPRLVHTSKHSDHYISPNEVFGDIMVLAARPPPPPVDPDDVNTLSRKVFNGSLSNVIYG